MPFLKSLIVLLALGYIMPSHGILRRLTAHLLRRPVRAFRMEGRATFMASVSRDVTRLLGTAWLTDAVTVHAHVSVDSSGNCRMTLSTDETSKTVSAMWAGKPASTVKDTLPALTTAVEAACIAHGPSSAARRRYLDAMGVETTQVFLARFNGEVAYVLGEKAAGSPQFWVYKRRFLPARIRTSDGWDVRFMRSDVYTTEVAWPAKLEVYKRGKLQLRLIVAPVEDS